MRKHFRLLAIVSVATLVFTGIVPNCSSTVYASEITPTETIDEPIGVNSFTITDLEVMPYIAAMDYIIAEEQQYKNHYELYSDAYSEFQRYTVAFRDILMFPVVKTNETISYKDDLMTLIHPDCTEVTGMVYDAGTLVVTESHSLEEFERIIRVLAGNGGNYFSYGLSTEAEGKEKAYEAIWFPGLLEFQHKGPLHINNFVYLTEDGTWEYLGQNYETGYNSVSELSKPGVYTIASYTGYSSKGYAPQAFFSKSTIIVQKEQK